MHRTCTFIAVCLSLILFSSYSPAQDEEESYEKEPEQRFTLKLTLSQTDVAGLRRNGKLRTPVPTRILNQVAAIKLQTRPSFLEETLDLQVRTDRLGDNIVIKIDESVIDRLEYQPIQMKIFQSNVKYVVFEYVPTFGMVPLLPSEGDQVELGDSNPLVVRLGKNRATVARIKDFAELKLKSDFGNIQLNSRDIQGIKFNVGSKGEVFVVLNSGDAFRATTSIRKLTIKTRWGDHQVDVDDLDSITTALNVQFKQVPDQIGKWKIVVLPIPGVQPQRPPLRRPPILQNGPGNNQWPTGLSGGAR